MDDKTKTGAPDSKLINISEDYEVAYWTKELGVTKEELVLAVHAAGTSVAAVRAHFKK